MTTARGAGRALRALGWLLASLALWVAVLPVSWVLVNGAHMVLTGERRAPTDFWEVAVLSWLYAGILPLVAVLGVLWFLARAGRPPFRRGAIVASLLLGGWLGAYLILLLEPAIQTVLVSWAAFGALVPRPPVGPRGAGLGPGALVDAPPDAQTLR